MDLRQFKELPLVGILRGVEADTITPLVEEVVSSGLKTVEITMNTPDAASLIKAMVKAAGGRLMIGAGTVLTMDDLKAAIDAGATFIVLPTLIDDIVKSCAKNKIPVFPGALTPQEIYNAWRAGATMVKVFPAKVFGPPYIKEIKGPFDKIELLACGGITPDNIASFFSSGASAVAFGGSVFKKEWLKKKEFSKIGESIRALITGYGHH
ncbi:MAG: bifunctional 4-hydroxy-2-oxoglutarate aldolase/2-dehydro-3-deoxy-phosphogluconate aldolase [Candidatus Omnitrophica bacterium]|nr:bifunctional 4-hydroxy-2-oxoglutarate aldolase/2-dehydro-3-deoxy-phosphogluconate aldolase [Candidatus Omnitrophota bacterium]